MAGGVEFILRWGQPGGAGGLNIAKIHFLEMLEKSALESYETSEGGGRAGQLGPGPAWSDSDLALTVRPPSAVPFRPLGRLAFISSTDLHYSSTKTFISSTNLNFRLRSVTFSLNISDFSLSMEHWTTGPAIDKCCGKTLRTTSADKIS